MELFTIYLNEEENEDRKIPNISIKFFKDICLKKGNIEKNEETYTICENTYDIYATIFFSMKFLEDREPYYFQVSNRNTICECYYLDECIFSIDMTDFTPKIAPDDTMSITIKYDFEYDNIDFI